MSVNTWDILQLIFMVWVILGIFIMPFVVMFSIELDSFKQGVVAIVAAILIWTILVAVGGFLYYKNMETKCMYDPGFDGPCIEQTLS